MKMLGKYLRVSKGKIVRWLTMYPKRWVADICFLFKNEALP